MDIFMSQINVDDHGLKSHITKRLSVELNNLAAPCYYPSLKKDYYEIMRLAGVSETDLKLFVKRFYKGTPGEKWLVTINPIVNLYIFLARYFLVKNDFLGYTLMVNFIILYWYQNLIRIHIPFCNEDAFRYATENIPRIHLFSREKTIGSALMYLASEVSRLYKDRLGEYSFNIVSNFIQISRSRVAQSIRSFAKAYFYAAEKGIKYKSVETHSTDEEEAVFVPKQVEEVGLKFADEISQRICVYQIIDKEAYAVAKRETHVNTKFGDSILEALSNLKYSDNVRIITILYLKRIKGHDISNLCSDQYIILVRKLMSIKRSVEQIYFKQQVGELTRKILEELGKLELTDSRKFLTISLFIAYYITAMIMKRICG